MLETPMFYVLCVIGVILVARVLRSVWFKTLLFECGLAILFHGYRRKRKKK